MEALYLLIPISLGIVFLAIWIFLRMSASGQFDDMEGPAYRILLDDDLPKETQTFRQEESTSKSPSQR